MRRLVPFLLFAATISLAVNSPGAGQDAKQPEKKTQPKKADPKDFIPDEATLKQIKDKTEQLRKAVEALKEKKIADDVFVEVAIYLKAAENIVRFEEWLAAASVKWALQTLDEGLARAKQAEGGKAVWRDAPGKWVMRAYRSHIDQSIQPYAVRLPADYGRDPRKHWRLDIVLHGRDSSITEAKFIATHNGATPKGQDFIQLEVYGRGNNAYRWAGETDVFEAMWDFEVWAKGSLDTNRVVLRGFSMGGAGTWHIGLHYPSKFCVLGPGAGFTTTHGYVGGLPKKLPDYQEKCLHIYDAVDYAENAFNVPVVAYSGEKDPQKKAADNIEQLLKGFKEPVKFTHLIAPGLEHQMPKEWQDKAETEYRKFADAGRTSPERVRFVTYTTKYNNFGWGAVSGLERHYDRAIVEGTQTAKGLTLTTRNVTALVLDRDQMPHPLPTMIAVDGQELTLDKEGKEVAARQLLVKTNGKWTVLSLKEIGDWQAELAKSPRKTIRRQGPIDDAFTGRFVVVGATGDGWPLAAEKQFAIVWDRYFRSTLPVIVEGQYVPNLSGNLVLFGDPQSNPLIAKVLPKLPITWTKDKLVVNGVEYDPKTHVPVLIYPNPLNENKSYVVINSGHTFREADLKGTNALLYPRLGDWAVIKPTPTDRDPAAYEVVAAGLFDENWQFPKKK